MPEYLDYSRTLGVTIGNTHRVLKAKASEFPTQDSSANQFMTSQRAPLLMKPVTSPVNTNRPAGQVSGIGPKRVFYRVMQ